MIAFTHSSSIRAPEQHRLDLDGRVGRHLARRLVSAPAQMALASVSKRGRQAHDAPPARAHRRKPVAAQDAQLPALRAGRGSKNVSTPSCVCEASEPHLQQRNVGV